MEAPPFLVSRLNMQLKFHGKTYTVNEIVRDKFGQPTEAIGGSYEVIAIWHEGNNAEYRKEHIADSGKTWEGKNVMLLCMKEDADKFSEGEIIEVNGSTYEVCNISDVNNFGITANISLKEVKI